MAISVSVRQAPQASAQTTLTCTLFPYCYGGLFGYGFNTWPYNYGFNGWNYWGSNSYWPYYNNYYGYNNYPSYLSTSYAYLPHYVYATPGTTTTTATGVSATSASPAWIFCRVPNGGPIWVDANRIPPGVMC